MQEFTFERNLDMGRYGFALSTLDGALQYIFEARTQLISMSERNERFWQAIRNGDLEQTRELFTEEMAMLRDQVGNNALHAAASSGKSQIVSYLMERMELFDRNDRGETVLMQAIYANSKETVQLILDEQDIDLEVRNNDGNTALLLAAQLCLNDVVPLLMHCGCSPYARNNDGRGILHLASKDKQLMLELLDKVDPCMLSWQDNHGETFLHLCQDPHIINKVVELNSCQDSTVLDISDNQGRTPLLTWASRGRMDLVEAFLSHKAATMDRLCARDKDGQNVLHLMVAALNAKFIEPKNLSHFLERFKDLVDVRDDLDGSSPLHVASKGKVTNDNRQFLFNFIRSLVIEFHARVDVRNSKGKRPAHIAQDPELLALLDGNQTIVELKMRKMTNYHAINF